MMTIKKLGLATLVAGMLGLAAAPASATLMLTLNDGLGHATSFTDNLAGDNDLGVGTLTLSATDFFGWSVRGTTGLSLTDPTGLHLDSFEVTSSSFGLGTLTITLSETGLTIPSLASAAFMTTVSGQTSENTANVTFKTLVNDVLVSTLGPYNAPQSNTSPGQPFIGAATADGISTIGGFNLTQVVTLTHTGKGSTSFAMETAVSEPLTVGLLGLGLLGLGIAKRRKGA